MIKLVRLVPLPAVGAPHRRGTPGGSANNIHEAKESYTVEPGRNIYRNGEPWLTIGKAGSTSPTEADRMTRKIAQLLNKYYAV